MARMGPEVMLATGAGGEDPLALIARLERAGWWFELKFDGVRAAVTVSSNGHVRISNRRQMGISYRYPDVVADIDALDVWAVLDGEIVVLDADARPDFTAIHMRDAQTSVPGVNAAVARHRARFVPFDVLEVRGEDVRGLGYEQRRQILTELVVAPMAVSPSRLDGAAMWEFVLERGLEGLVAKEPGSVYGPGRRRAWQKIKATKRLLAMVVAVQPGKGSRGPVGALSLRLWDTASRTLVDIGTVGSGLAQADLRFFETWIKEDPTALVVEVEFLEVGSSGKLRMPVFKGVRAVSVEECTTAQTAYRR